jgi:hypothetical protein
MAKDFREQHLLGDTVLFFYFTDEPSRLAIGINLGPDQL